VTALNISDPSLQSADHRAEAQADNINSTNHPILKYVGGTVSLEMETPKILWLKENFPPDQFAKWEFWDLPDW
jgi:D-ribulokinase